MHVTINPTGRLLEGKDEEVLYQRMRDEMIMKRQEGVFHYPTSHIHSNLVNRQTANQIFADTYRRCKSRDRQEAKEANFLQALVWMWVCGRREDCDGR